MEEEREGSDALAAAVAATEELHAMLGGRIFIESSETKESAESDDENVHRPSIEDSIADSQIDGDEEDISPQDYRNSELNTQADKTNGSRGQDADRTSFMPTSHSQNIVSFSEINLADYEITESSILEESNINAVEEVETYVDCASENNEIYEVSNEVEKGDRRGSTFHGAVLETEPSASTIHDDICHSEELGERTDVNIDDEVDDDQYYTHSAFQDFHNTDQFVSGDGSNVNIVDLEEELASTIASTIASDENLDVNKNVETLSDGQVSPALPPQQERNPVYQRAKVTVNTGCKTVDKCVQVGVLGIGTQVSYDEETRTLYDSLEARNHLLEVDFLSWFRKKSAFDNCYWMECPTSSRSSCEDKSVLEEIKGTQSLEAETIASATNIRYRQQLERLRLKLTNLV